MARISGVDLPKEKRVEIGLTYIYGIGKATSDEILKTTGIDPDKRVKDLSDDEVAVLRNYIEHNLLNIKRLVEVGCYRGLRHRRGLPVRGQNTKTNARTRKGPKTSRVKSKKK